jgi:lipopolysaccharide export system protein LptA
VILILVLALALLTAPVLAAPARTLELRASEVTVRDAGRVIDARGNVRITDGRNRVRADRALYAVRDRRIQLTGGVSVVSSDGTLEAQRAAILLTQNRRIETVEASGNAVLKTGSRVLRASRVSYTVGTEAVSASGNVSLSIPPDIVATGQDLVVRGLAGGGGRADGGGQAGAGGRAGSGGATATLTGQAKVQNKDGFIQGDRIEFVEREEVAHARGNVTAVFQDTRIRSAEATFFGRERKAVFRHGVTVTRPGRTMKAEVVTVFYDDRRIVAEGEINITFDEERREP